ncbi:MAG: 5-(carboxyamino)imidazole ribonucleotide mutase [Firmicutes bacterium]|nr:5-(carboxyamino)imidazole ribonucleotide mutase [Bacillota bacterium]
MAVQPSNVSSSAASAARPRVVVVMGSDSDLEVMRPAAEILAELGIPVQMRVLSAHRTPEDAAAFARQAAGEGVQALIAGAGGAAHLAGFLAAHTWLPVIGVPVQSGPLAGLDALYSTVQMPPGVPVATVGINNARNAGLLAAQILAVSNGKVRAALEAFRQRQAAGVRAKDERVRQEAFPTQ